MGIFCGYDSVSTELHYCAVGGFITKRPSSVRLNNYCSYHNLFLTIYALISVVCLTDLFSALNLFVSVQHVWLLYYSVV